VVEGWTGDAERKITHAVDRTKRRKCYKAG
jgi:hypothetical protein